MWDTGFFILLPLILKWLLWAYLPRESSIKPSKSVSSLERENNSCLPNTPHIWRTNEIIHKNLQKVQFWNICIVFFSTCHSVYSSKGGPQQFPLLIPKPHGFWEMFELDGVLPFISFFSVLSIHKIISLPWKVSHSSKKKKRHQTPQEFRNRKRKENLKQQNKTKKTF